MTTTPPEPPGPPSGGDDNRPPAPGAFGSGQLSQQDERMWAMLAHIGAVILGFIAPLIVLLVQGEKSPFTRANAVESLNFQITALIYAVISGVLVLVVIGLFLLLALAVFYVVVVVLATVRAASGQEYRYPLTLRLVS